MFWYIQTLAGTLLHNSECNDDSNILSWSIREMSYKKYKKVLHLIIKNNEKLQAITTDKQRELFSRYTNSASEYQVIADSLLFQQSFHLEEKMVLEVTGK